MKRRYRLSLTGPSDIDSTASSTIKGDGDSTV